MYISLTIYTEKYYHFAEYFLCCCMNCFVISLIRLDSSIVVNSSNSWHVPKSSSFINSLLCFKSYFFFDLFLCFKFSSLFHQLVVVDHIRIVAVFQWDIRFMSIYMSFRMSISSIIIFFSERIFKYALEDYFYIIMK